MAIASATWMLILGALLVPNGPPWEVVRSADGDFAFSIPAKPAFESQSVQGQRGAIEILKYSCRVGGSEYRIERVAATRPVASGEVIAELARLKKRLFKEDARLVSETKIVVDGVVGDDFTYNAPSPQGDGRVNKQTRHFLTGYFYYVLTVTSAPGKALPEDAGRFLSSLTFEAVVKAHMLKEGVELKPVVKPERGAGKAAANRE